MTPDQFIILLISVLGIFCSLSVVACVGILAIAAKLWTEIIKAENIKRIGNRLN